MIKFIAIIFALLVLGYFIARPFLQSKGGARSGGKNSRSGKSEVIEDMQECAVCGTYIATHEALLSQGRYFCSSACKDDFAQNA